MSEPYDFAKEARDFASEEFAIGYTLDQLAEAMEARLRKAYVTALREVEVEQVEQVEDTSDE